MAQYFNGRFITQPSTNVYVDNSRLANVNPGAANILALVGPSTAGVPQSPIQISDPAAARRILRSGDLLEAVLLAFAPSAQTGGATILWVVRVNSAVQGRAKVFDIANPVKASQTFTVAGGPVGGNTVTATIGGVASVYTVGGGDTTSTVAAGLAAAINANTSAVLTDALSGVLATSAGAVVTVTARYAGVDSNTITTTAGATGGGATLTAGGATLTGGTGNTVITLKSSDYGLYTNQIFFQFSAGGVTGTKTTLGLTTTGNVIGGTLAQDNIARTLFTIQYTGAGSASTLTVNDSALTTSCTGAVADNLNIQFSTYGTIQQVIDAISATGKYSITAAVTSSAALPSASQFDPKTAIDIKTSGQILTANLQAIVDFLNSSVNTFCTATRTPNPVAGLPVYTGNNTYFVGGTDGTTSTGTDWPTAINTLQTVDVDVIVPVTDLAAVHSSVLNHVQFMSTTGRKPRVAVVGGALAEYNAAAAVPTSTITARTIALNSERILLVSPGVNTFDSLGNAVTRAPYFTAAMVGGMLAAVPAGTPLTHKYLSNITSLEVNFSPADKDALLQGGVCPLELVTNKGIRVVQSKTTWLGTPNFSKNEISTLRAIDTVVRRVQDTLDDQLVGQKVAPETLAQAASITETVLKQAIIDGLIVGDSKNPAYTAISASSSGGDTIRVQFQMSPAIPANYVNVTIATIPYAGTVATSS
jgi:phage tail sheath gpL-like